MLHRWKGHQAVVASLDCSPTKPGVLTASVDGVVKYWTRKQDLS